MDEVHEALLRRLLVGVDGSEGSRRALAWAARLAQDTGSQVLAVHVLTYNSELVHDISPETMRTWRRELQAALKTRWVEPLNAQNVSYRCRVVESDSAASGLLEVAGHEKPDLLIIGSKDHRNVADRFRGSVSHRLTHRAQVPVVVVRFDGVLSSQ